MYISKETKADKNNFLLTVTSRHFSSKRLLALFSLIGCLSPPEKNVNIRTKVIKYF